jgi:hypothetical protein
MIRYSDSEIINHIINFYKNTGKVPTKKEFTVYNGYISNWVVINRFGSWNNGLKAAGLPIYTKQLKNNSWDKDSIIEYTKNYINKNNKYPTSSSAGSPSISTIKRYFNSWAEVYEVSGYRKKVWDKDSILNSIYEFHKNFNKVPTSKDFRKNTVVYPNSYIINKFFGSWNNAILESNLPISIKNGYGILTNGLDGHTYRSSAEAYFCDNYLYNKYTYHIEPKYPCPYEYLLYDWYLPELNLYIELDGGIRPTTTKEKIKINNSLNRKCVFINTYNIYDKNYIDTILV